MAIRNNKCRHFNGVGNDKCEAGVRYTDVRVENANPAPGGYSLPCLTKYNPAGAICGKCEFPTPEELAKEEQEMKVRMANTMKAREAIVTHCGGKWKKGDPGKSGTIQCPVCGGQSLRYSRAGYNGHIHASCSTKDCVSWME